MTSERRKIKLPQEFQSIWGLNLTVQTSKLRFSNFITNCVDCVFFFGDFRWFSHLPQFVINFWNLNCPRSFKVYVPVSPLQLIRGLNLTVQTSKLKFSNFITNCVDCVFWRFSMIFAFTAICKTFHLNCPRGFKVYVPVSSLQLIRGLKLTVQTSKLKFSNFITNCVDCVFFFFFLAIFDDFRIYRNL